ncbi:MAG: 5'/3'-nucleotidase SurE [Chloroflexota bacterium]
MHILVTNDDGVHAPGLLALAKTMRQCGEVSVVAPDRNWSGCGHVKTLNRPLRVREVRLADGTTALASDGAPSDCVAMAVMGLLPQKVDLVVSGINPMANMGHDVTYSGTVTAVMESIIWGVPGIAVSLDGGRSLEAALDFSAAARVTRFVVRNVLERSLPKGVFLNVNVPNLPADSLKGIRPTRQGMRVYRDRLEQRQDPRGNAYYWIGGDMPSGVVEKGTDIGAVANGYVSITPLQLNMTAYPALLGLSRWQWEDALNPTASSVSQPHQPAWG